MFVFAGINGRKKKNDFAIDSFMKFSRTKRQLLPGTKKKKKKKNKQHQKKIKFIYFYQNQ
jgi:hypothetical protein